MSPRTFKVMELADFGSPSASHIRFRGHWLRSIGFTPGVSFSVHSPSPGILVLRVQSPAPSLPDPEFAAAVSQFAKLGI